MIISLPRNILRVLCASSRTLRPAFLQSKRVNSAFMCIQKIFPVCLIDNLIKCIV